MPSTARNNLKIPPFLPTAILPDTKDEPNTTETSSDDLETTYPEGGLRAWFVVLGSFCGMYATPSLSQHSLLKS
jgi:hypothetical protein